MKSMCPTWSYTFLCVCAFFFSLESINCQNACMQPLNPWTPWAIPGSMFNYRLGNGRGLNYRLSIGSGPAGPKWLKVTHWQHGQFHIGSGSEFNCRLCIGSEVTYTLQLGTLLAKLCAVPVFKIALFCTVYCVTLPEQAPQDTHVRPKNFSLNNSAPSTRPPFPTIVSNMVLLPCILISLKNPRCLRLLISCHDFSQLKLRTYPKNKAG